MERRKYFRVQDVLPLTAKVIDEKDQSRIKSQVLYGRCLPSAPPLAEDGEESIHPHLWRLFSYINTKLDIILDRMNAMDPWLDQAEKTPVSISEGGIQFISRHAFRKGDLLEIKILLSTSPGLSIAVYARVKRANALPNQSCDIAAQFVDMEESVQEVIYRYILQRQRDLIRKQLEEESLE